MNMSSKAKRRIVLVVGEASGDLLGSALIEELNQRFSEVEFVGIGGPLMIAQGFDAWYRMSELSVMGYVEVIKKLPKLICIRSSLIRRILRYQPDLVVGIDAPDFNLFLERSVRKSGVPVVHLVSPSIWAWRYERIHKIRESVDRMLVLFPFEEEIYKREGIPVSYVGHPLADQIELVVDRFRYRDELGFTVNQKLVALLPGSRRSELKQHLDLMLDAAELIKSKYPDVRFAIPLINEDTVAFSRGYMSQRRKDLIDEIKFVSANTQNVLKAADLAIIASGTATLEALLCECPMVVTYKVSQLTAWLMRRRARTTFVSLPNIIANEHLVDEFIQERARSHMLADAVISLFGQPEKLAGMRTRFREIKKTLRVGSAIRSADVIQKFVGMNE
ncbi:MAG: lipid-A-disaccharide synthase [Betaproteobacteria bacterium]|nr:lipid-A-disaccharide synthase [Betaproteobacteria bacterium]